MSASPISASDESLVALFAAAQAMAAGCAVTLPPAPAGADLAAHLGRAVAAHLAGRAALLRGENGAAEAGSAAAVAAFETAAALVAREGAGMTPLSAIYHARMASRHGDEYRTLALRSVLCWIEAGRAKSCFLAAHALWQGGARAEAIRLASGIRTGWSDGPAPRLPGLAAIDAQLRAWRTEASVCDPLPPLSPPAKLAPWPAPAGPWSLPLRPEEMARCAFSATLLP